MVSAGFAEPDEDVDGVVGSGAGDVVVVGVVGGAVDAGVEEGVGALTSVGDDIGMFSTMVPTPTATTRLATTRIAVELNVLARSHRIAERAGLSMDARRAVSGSGRC
jgi:hypothetical protein